MNADEFARALLNAGRTEAPPPGAYERALAAMAHGAAGGSSGAAAVKWVLFTVAVSALSLSAWRFTRPTAPATTTTKPTPPIAVATSPSPPARSAAAPMERPARAPKASSPREPRPPAAAAAPTAPTVCSTPGRVVHMIIENQLRFDVDVEWINDECVEEPRGRVVAGATYHAISYDTHPFRLYRAGTRDLVRELATMSPDPDTATIFIDGSQAPVDSPPTACSTKDPMAGEALFFVNGLAGAVDAYWIDGACREVWKGRIEPGDQLEQETWSTHSWRFRDARTHALVQEIKSAPPAEWRTVLK